MTAAQIPPTRPDKPSRTPRDMALSLIVLLIPVFLIVVAYRTLYGGDTVVTVDPSAALGSATRAGLTDLPPSAAPAGWVIVSAQFRDGVLRIGYLDGKQRGAQLVQSRTDIAKTELAGGGETRMVGSRNGVTVVLVGRGVDLQVLAATLPISVADDGVGK